MESIFFILVLHEICLMAVREKYILQGITIISDFRGLIIICSRKDTCSVHHNINLLKQIQYCVFRIYAEWL